MIVIFILSNPVLYNYMMYRYHHTTHCGHQILTKMSFVEYLFKYLFKIEWGQDFGYLFDFGMS